MPAYDKTETFKRGCKHLSKQDQQRFLAALRLFIEDLVAREAGSISNAPFRPALRVKQVRGERGERGVWEMTWAPDGRAAFAYGKPIQDDTTHIVWLDIGGHEILP